MREALGNADGVRWMSLSSLLPQLAEAAPDEFLSAVETSLAMAEAPVARLFSETTSGIMGRCWYSGLLWALESLAWEPVRMPRVAFVLAALSRPHVKTTWVNSPRESLLGIFRSWLPQTAAALEQRIAALDLLAAREGETAFDLLCGLVDNGMDTACPAQRPSWRDEDVGAGHGVPEDEIVGMVDAAAKRLFVHARGDARRVARLIKMAHASDTAGMAEALACAEKFAVAAASDEDRDAIRAVLREKLHWHRRHDQTLPETLERMLRPLQDVYDRLQPQDLLVRHRWLFAAGWCDLPTPKRDDWSADAAELHRCRVAALREVYEERGLPGVEQLAVACTTSYTVGHTLAALELGTPELAGWIAGRGGDFDAQAPLTAAIGGLVCALAVPRSDELLQAVLRLAKEEGWEASKTAGFCMLAPACRATWDAVSAREPEVEKAYWGRIRLMMGPQTDATDFEFVLDRLLSAGRPRSALEACAFKIKTMDAGHLVQMLERMLAGQEPDGPRPDSWHVIEAVQRLETGKEVDKERLLRLEFGLFPALRFEASQCPTTLYTTIMSTPALFRELLCLLYKPASVEREESFPEKLRASAEIAREVLHYCRCQPGTRPNGTVDPEAFVRFVDETRRLCGKADRLGVCDSNLGRILAHAPADADGTWPFEPARTVLDRPECEEMRQGFRVGCRNRRGVVTRSPDEGGDQERSLAETYHRHARAVCHSHPRLAATLDQLASWYEDDARQEDDEAALSREGY